MIRVLRTPTDAPEFIERIERLLTGALATPRPPSVCLVRVDQWFDAHWLKFSGKVMGAFGIAMHDVTVPPFHPHRVQGEHWLRLQGVPLEYTYDASKHPELHIHQPSERNLRRKLSGLAPGVMCAWYSGDSATLRRGSLMVYTPAIDSSYWCWYVALAAAGSGWRATKFKGITPVELEMLDHVADPSRTAV